MVSQSGSDLSQERSRLDSWLCKASNYVSVYEYATSAAGKASGLFSEIGIDLAGSMAAQQGQVQKWQMSQCESYVNSLDQGQVLTYLSTITDNRPALGAWIDCVHNIAELDMTCVGRQQTASGLFIVFDPPDPSPGSSFTVQTTWCGSGGAYAYDATVKQPLRVVGATCTNSTRSVGSAVALGAETLICRRDSDDEIIATMTVGVACPDPHDFPAQNYLPPWSACGDDAGPCCGDDAGACGGSGAQLCRFDDPSCKYDLGLFAP